MKIKGFVVYYKKRLVVGQRYTACVYAVKFKLFFKSKTAAKEWIAIDRYDRDDDSKHYDLTDYSDYQIKEATMEIKYNG